MRMKEEDRIQTDFFKFCRGKRNVDRRLDWIFSIPNGSYKTEAQRVLFQYTGLHPGVWDVFCPWPGVWKDRKYPGLWIEFKAGSRRLTPEQERFLIECIVPAGYAYGLYRSYIPACVRLCQYLGIYTEDIRRELEWGSR